MSRNDAIISVILLAIWAGAMLLVLQGGNRIPLSMLGLATVFFILLLPAMRDLVRAMEKYAYGTNEEADSAEE